MNEVSLEHALYSCQESGGYRFIAQSFGILPEWLPELQRLCTGFGERPSNVACPEALFACPLDKKHIVVAQVADQGTDDTGRPGAIGFYLLIIPTDFYRFLGGDPFLIAERNPPLWHARGEIPPRGMAPEPPPPRTVKEVEAILKSPDSATLLGAAQALLDGGRLVFQREAPAPQIVRHLWTLLPVSSRSELWPSTFLFSNALELHVVVTPRVDETLSTYLTEVHAGDYPEGRYELHLQMATERGDQAELDRLFSRRSSKETLRLAVLILALALTLPFLANWIGGLVGNNNQQGQGTTGKAGSTSRQPATNEKPELMPSDRYAPLGEAEEESLRSRLFTLLRGVSAGPAEPEVRAIQAGSIVGWCTPSSGAFWQIPVAGLSPREWVTSQSLVLSLDAWLDPEAKRALDLRPLSPVQQRLQGLLWKHGVERYNDPRLTPLELLERLEEKVPKLQGRRSNGNDR